MQAAAPVDLQIQDDASVNRFERALAKAYTSAADSLDILNSPEQVFPMEKSEENASIQCTLIQKGLMCDWSVIDVCHGLECTLEKFQDDAVVILERNEKRGITGCASIGINVHQMTKKVFGLAQVFRLIKSTKAGQVHILFFSKNLVM